MFENLRTKNNRIIPAKFKTCDVTRPETPNANQTLAPPRGITTLDTRLCQPLMVTVSSGAFRTNTLLKIGF